MLPKYRTVIFVNGCFWHMHDCPDFVWPSSNREYWNKKINNNVERDKMNYRLLENLGWRIITVWECQLKKDCFEETMDNVISLIKASQ